MTMRTMARLPRIFGTLGLAILLGHYVDGLFDIFWIGASMIPPLVIVGMSLGVADLDGRDRQSRMGPSGRPVGLGVEGPRPAPVGRSPGGAGWSLERVARWTQGTLVVSFRTAFGLRLTSDHR